MMVRLLAPHFIYNQIWQSDTVLNVNSVSPLMEGLDDDAVAAIAAEKIRVFGRWVWKGKWTLLDDPPIDRPLFDPQPTPVVGGDGPP